MENKEVIYNWSDDFVVEMPTASFNTFPDETNCSFEVAKVETTKTKKDSKPMLKISLRLTHKDFGTAYTTHYLVMTSLHQNKINEFLGACGLLGEKMKWAEILERIKKANGLCRVKLVEYESKKTDENGEPYVNERNEIDCFYLDYEAMNAVKPTPTAKPSNNTLNPF